MGCSRYIGRVGALAVFLGVGVSVTSGQAFASAEPSSDTAHATQAAAPSKPGPKHAPTPATAASPDATPASTSDDSTPSGQKPKRQPKNKSRDSAETAGRHRDANPTRHTDSALKAAPTATSSESLSATTKIDQTRPTATVSYSRTPAVAATSAVPATASVTRVAAVPLATVVTPTVSAPSVPNAINQIVTAAKQLIGVALRPLVSTLPSNVPANSPALWTVLAWVRRQIETNLLPPHVVSAWNVTSPNLLTNPGAEFGDPSLSGGSTVSIPGWTVTGTPTVIPYGTKRQLPLGLPTPGPTLPAIFNFPSDRPTPGDTQFFGGGNVATSTLTQTVDLSGAAASIDAGTMPFKLSGFLGGAMIDPSAASIKVTFFDATGTQLGVGKVAPVGPLERWFQTGLLERSTEGTIPVSTRTAQVVVTLKDSNPFTGGYNNAFADDLSFTVGAALPTPPPPTPPKSTVGALDHVFMVYLENKGYKDIVGSPNAPYLNSLIDTYGVAANYYALTHPSDPNYYPILGGSDFGLSYNCATNCIDATNLADRIESAGKTWAGYAQGMSAAGPYVSTSDYAPDQLPFLAYRDIYNDQARATAHLHPLTQLATDLSSSATTPNFAWFAANEANNGEGPIDSVQGVLNYIGALLTNHQYNVKAADQFAAQTIPTILNSAVWNDPTQKSAIVVTFDEGTDNLSLGFGNGGNRVVTVVIPSPGAVSAGMRSGNFTDTSYANHYSLLRTIEDSLKLDPLTNNDAYAVPLNDFWGTPPVVP
ncbi:alkaline phosphatase family protein [Mycolicibacterium phocaicum]|uniref:alkaline phosphatase family protein n=1 Tax=Mycolicibacterium phocaicum TaxID=319706 RepID=UPI001CFA4341|nr:alkaline phosphatase family protein [Mycolicibacterium phocaicum]UCZ58616.1 phosphoesterase [Mycolicibacterium phocaicum]